MHAMRALKWKFWKAIETQKIIMFHICYLFPKHYNSKYHMSRKSQRIYCRDLVRTMTLIYMAKNVPYYCTVALAISSKESCVFIALETHGHTVHIVVYNMTTCISHVMKWSIQGNYLHYLNAKVSFFILKNWAEKTPFSHFAITELVWYCRASLYWGSNDCLLYLFSLK
jgi:hypothetical protein